MISTWLAHLALAVDDVELGHDGERLQPDREAQQVLVVAVGVGAREVEEQGGQHRHRVDEQVVVQRVGLGVVAEAVGLFRADEVDDVGGRGDEEDLEEGVVDRDVEEEEVGVARAEDDEVDFLGAVGKLFLAGLGRSCSGGSG